MIAANLPNHDRPRVYADARAEFRWAQPGMLLPDTPCNFITHFRSASMCYPAHDGLLSIKTARNGQEVYEAEGMRYAVNDKSYLILNAGQPYGCSIESQTEVESFCVFFRPGLAEEALHSLVTPDDRLLDEPPASGQPVQFFAQTYPLDDLVSAYIDRLYGMLMREEVSSARLEEAFHQLAHRLLLAHREVGRQVARMPGARLSTRVELYRRLHRARDFMEAHLAEPITLARIAEAAWFSPHHFLRSFHRAFGETPHQYLTRQRIERAKRLLTQTDLPVTEICYEIGFESLGSFGVLFRRQAGLSPNQYRLTNRITKL